MRNLLTAELLKLRRSWFLLIILLGALSGPLLMALAWGSRKETMADYYTAEGFIQQILSFQGMLTGGLLAALIGTQLFVTEFQSDTWKLALTAPVRRWQVFLAKTLIALMLMFLASMVTAGATFALIPVMGLKGVIQWSPWIQAFLLCGGLTLALMPFYHGLTLISRNFFVSTGTGIALTLLGVIISSSKYAGFYPNSAGLIFSNPLVSHHPIPDELVGNPTVWLAVAGGIFVLGLLAGLVQFVRADFK